MGHFHLTNLAGEKQKNNWRHKQILLKVFGLSAICESSVFNMSFVTSDEFGFVSLLVGETYFTTLNLSTNTYTYRVFDEYSGKYFNLTTAEWYIYPVTELFDLGYTREDCDIHGQ